LFHYGEGRQESTSSNFGPFSESFELLSGKVSEVIEQGLVEVAFLFEEPSASFWSSEEGWRDTLGEDLSLCSFPDPALWRNAGHERFDLSLSCAP